jgi:hypothetical protein
MEPWTQIRYWSTETVAATSSSHAQFSQYLQGFNNTDIIIIYNDEEMTVSENSFLCSLTTKLPLRQRQPYEST